MTPDARSWTGAAEMVLIGDQYEIEITAIFKTLLAMENDGVITHDQFLHYAKISEDEYVNLALTLYYDKKETE